MGYSIPSELEQYADRESIKFWVAEHGGEGHVDNRPIRGRGAQGQVANRFDSVRVELDRLDPSLGDQPTRPRTQFLVDDSKSIVSENRSPDIPFRYSLNPYRGCEHGCPYCYARPTHEYLGLSAGLDFETKIIVKQRAALLLRDVLAKPSWRAESLMLSGVTDPYQPIDARKRSRAVPAVASRLPASGQCDHQECIDPCDVDILAQLAKDNLVQAAISITTLDVQLANVLAAEQVRRQRGCERSPCSRMPASRYE